MTEPPCPNAAATSFQSRRSRLLKRQPRRLCIRVTTFHNVTQASGGGAVGGGGGGGVVGGAPCRLQMSPKEGRVPELQAVHLSRGSAFFFFLNSKQTRVCFP